MIIDRLVASDTRVLVTRALSITALVAFACFWHVRTTASVSWPAFALLAACMLVFAEFGAVFARATAGIVGSPIGLAYEVLLGFLIVNTLLFVLTLASPLGLRPHLAMVGAVAVLVRLTFGRHGAQRQRDLQSEIGSLICILFSGVAATLWVHDQQPMTRTEGGLSVFTVWSDVFIHVREIGALAHAHGLPSLSDIKLSGVPAAAYHLASYMVPAALNALTSTSAFDSYAAFQLPFGIVLVGVAGYALVAGVLETTWPAVIASAALVALPDAAQQGFAIQLLSFHFMSQANLGMLYGIACMATAWLFMIEGCRRDRLAGVAIAWVFLAVCLTYKAHLFVANALVLMLYPCALFGRFRWHWRVLAAIGATLVFVAVIAIAQASPRVPVMRLDGSGLGQYVEMLLSSAESGRLTAVFHSIYDRHPWPRVVKGVLAASLIVLASFGFWVVAGPIALWRARRMLDPRAIGFVAVVFVNYLVMSTMLALDDRGVGSAEEFLNRPHSWAYFVVVLFVVAAATLAAAGRPRPLPWARWLAVPAACAALFGVERLAVGLQTYPAWKGRETYAGFNTAPLCLTRSAQYIRDHGRVDDVMLDSRFDPGLVASALAERPSFVSNAAFGGYADVVRRRIELVKAMRDAGSALALQTFAHEHGIAWYLMHPDDEHGLDRRFLDDAAFRCDGYSVFRFDP